MLMKCLVSSVLLMAASSVNAGCWVIGNLHGYGAYEYDHYNFKEDGYAGKVFVVNIDKNSPSVTDSIMTYSFISPTSMVGTYATDLGLTIQTWQISTDKTKAFMTFNRTNTNNIVQDAVSSFVGDVKARCDH